jgi:Domain of unknown function (DUF932)
MENQVAKNILENIAPSALTAAPSLELVAPTYGFINTSDIVGRFERQGWKLHSGKQARVKDIERQGYQKHLLKFRHDNFKRIEGLSIDNASVPELIVENSHDGTSALKIFFGVFRIACLNGIIAGASVTSMRVVHSSGTIKKLDNSIDEMTERLPMIAERVSRFSQIQLTPDQRLEMARQAAALRLAHTPGVEWIDHAKILRPKRLQDTGSDLFSVFNVIQEKVIRGGINFSVRDKEGRNVHKLSRGISSVTQSVKLNRGLWDIAERLAS